MYSRPLACWRPQLEIPHFKAAGPGRSGSPYLLEATSKSGSAKGLDIEGRGPLRTAPSFLPPLRPLHRGRLDPSGSGAFSSPRRCQLSAHMELLQGGKRSQGQVLTRVMGDPKRDKAQTAVVWNSHTAYVPVCSICVNMPGCLNGRMCGY